MACFCHLLHLMNVFRSCFQFCFNPGFPVKWLDDEMKVWKAEQIMKNFNNENFLQHLAEGKFLELQKRIALIFMPNFILKMKS